MQSASIVLLVRDAKTGELLVTPEDEECWLVRERVGYGRGSEDDWIVRKQVGEGLFEHVSGKQREWQFGFTDYYDVIVWDLMPGRPYAALYSVVQDLMVKAHRVTVGMDMYNPMASVLKTLHTERDTGRARTVKPGEMSIYDDLHHEGSRFVFWDTTKKDEQGQRPEAQAAPTFFYSDIDALEDAVLFPEELGGHASTKIADRTDRLTTTFRRSGPNWKRFVNGLDSDDDSDDYDEPFEEDASKAVRKAQKASRGTVKDAVKETEDTPSGAPITSCACKQCKKGRPELCEDWEDEDDSKDYIYDTADGDPETLKIALAFEALEPEEGYGANPERDFWEYMDREKAKIFKQCWRASILDYHKRKKYDESDALVKRLSAQEMTKADTQSSCKTLLWLHVHLADHRLVWKDMVRAFCSMSPFFDDTEATSRSSVYNEIADNASRARLRPYSRTFQSNILLPAKFWKEADVVNEKRQEAYRRRVPFYDSEGDKWMRPAIANWFKAGVICPDHIPYPPGDCVVIQEQDRDQPGLFMDYRSRKSDWPSIKADMTDITNPYSIDIVRIAREFSLSKPDARFALLRVWSHSHFYPLMLGWDNRINSSFKDEVKCTWSWKFVPRDMPGSEWSMQKGVDLRIDPFRKRFGKQVVVKRDMVLVVAKDEQELKRLAVAACYAIQTKPWRMDVDLWKSFVNVPLSFLEGLDKEWVA